MIIASEYDFSDKQGHIGLNLSQTQERNCVCKILLQIMEHNDAQTLLLV